MDLFSNRLRFNFENWLSRTTFPFHFENFWKEMSSKMARHIRGCTLSYLVCKFDIFTCLLVMIKTNTTRK